MEVFQMRNIVAEAMRFFNMNCHFEVFQMRNIVAGAEQIFNMTLSKQKTMLL